MNGYFHTARAWLLGSERAEAEAGGAGQVLSLRARWCLYGLFVLLVLLRLPEAVWYGRFLCEEGVIFFAYAWHHGGWDALWRSFGGYLNLGANGSGLLAAWLVRGGYISLESAPRLTMAIALAFQTLPAVLLLNGRAPWLTRRWVVVASLLAVLIPPMTEEVWLNVLHIQYHLVLCCALVLAFETPRSVMGWAVDAFVLVLAPLCGPGAMVLGPLFLARSLWERSLARLVQTGLLGMAGLVQLLVFFVPSPVRGQFHSPAELASIMMVRLGFLPFGGERIGNGVGDLAVMAYERHGIAWIVFSALALIYCAFLALLAWRRRNEGSGWLIAAGLMLAAVSFGGGMISTNTHEWFSMGSGERYNYLPLALLGLGLVAIARDQLAQGSKLALRLCGLVLFVGLCNYFSPIRELSRGPHWSGEVAQWRNDHNYPLRTWPERWVADLSDRDLPCPKPTLQNASYDAPTYCEANWLAMVVHGPKPQKN